MLEARKAGLIARLATTPTEVKAAQRLRYTIFYEELAAVASNMTSALELDVDIFDSDCDHVLVISEKVMSASPILVDGGELIGTYRLLPQARAQANNGFYTQQEFDIEALLVSMPEKKFLELGRSCIHRQFRAKPALELLWQVIWNYVREHEVDVLFGCASFIGANEQQTRHQRAILHKSFSAPTKWQVYARVSPNTMVSPSQTLNQAQERAAFIQLPALLKSYLKIGAYVAKDAVIDKQFNTIDVLVMLPIANIDKKYFSRFGPPRQNG